MPQFRVTTDHLNLRTGPGTNNPATTQLNANTTVEKLEASADGQWFRVSTQKDGSAIEGWVASKFLISIDGPAVVPPHLSGDGWLESIGAFHVERAEIPRPGNKPYFNNSHTRIGVLHTTESNKVGPAFNTLKLKHSAPHFISGENRILQCRPITKQGAALLSTSQYNPNTDAALQIEMVGSSQQQLWMPPESSLAPVLAIIRWANGDPLNIPLRRPVDSWLDDCSDVALPWAVSNNARRKASNIWPKIAGWYMHMEVPVNNHWDCGAIRFREILAMAAQ
jgi:hypothetical protein